MDTAMQITPIPEDEQATVFFQSEDESLPPEIMRWQADGKIFWNSKEIETDDELKQMIKEIHGWMCNNLAQFPPS
jgi:hypothetical protein